jgi:hypothetical protein
MFKKGEKAVQILRGAGVETASIRTITKATKTQVWTDLSDHPQFDQLGRELENGGFGFAKRLVVLEDGDVK